MHKITTAAVTGALLVPAATNAALAAETKSVIATYHGKTISLAESWEDAHDCAVLTVDDVRCYDSEKEMRDDLTAAAHRAVPSGLVSPSLVCGGAGIFVTLYRDISMGGGSINFQSTVNWANLAPYGFDDDMESWVNDTGCAATVAENTGGGGAQLTLAAHSSSSNVGTTWKNRASSIKVLP